MTYFEKLEKEIDKKAIDWKTVEPLIKKIAPVINDEMDDYNVPSCSLALLLNLWGHTGEDLVKLFKLFIKNGFDPKANDYNNGYSVLCALAYTTGDHYILDAAKLLFDKGAKVDDATFESISWQLGDWTVGDCDYAIIITSYCALANQIMQGEEFQKIECWDYVKRKKLDKIERFVINTDENEQRENYVLWFEGIPLIINEYVETYVNPYILNKAFDRTDISKDYSDIIGRKLKRIHYIDALTVHLQFFNNCTFVAGQSANNLELKSMLLKEKATLIIDDKINSIKVDSGGRYAKDVRIYKLDTVFLLTDNNSLQITNYDNHRENYLSINKIAPELIREDCETITITTGKICEYFYHIKNEKEITGICIECDEGYLYIRSSSFRDIEMFLSERKFSVQEFKICETYHKEVYKNLKKIKSFKICD